PGDGSPAIDTLGRPITSLYYDTSGQPQSVNITFSGSSYATTLCPYASGDVCTENSGGMGHPETITLPNGLSYIFTYYSGTGTYGEPASVTLPSGAIINWTYGDD